MMICNFVMRKEIHSLGLISPLKLKGEREREERREREREILENEYKSSIEVMKQALRFAEDLTLPKIQVVVMRANMSCKHCRNRVSTIISKMNAGLLDYMVDLRKKEVTLTATIDHNHIKKNNHETNKKSSCFFKFFRITCTNFISHFKKSQKM